MIASSPTDVGPVLNAIVESACELCEAHDAVLRLKDGENLCVSAHHGPIPTVRERWPINPKWTAGRCVLDRKPIHVCDMLSPEGAEFPEGRRPGATRGLRTILSVPLLREGEPIGAITLRRTEVHPFSNKQMNLLQTFADQAVIAIENARLFDEVRARTRDLEESLQQQTATSEVLQVINSSPGELAPVFDAMLERAMRLCQAAFGGLWVFEGDRYVAAALRGVPPDYATYLRRTTVVPGPHTAPYRFLEGERSVIQSIDLAAEEPYRAGDPQRRALVDVGGARTALHVPLVRDDVVLGNITVYRQEVRPFSDKQIGLLQNFGAQAVVAIENVRLFKETKEALQQQTATADVLKVISRSAFDLDSVLATLVASAARLCEAERGLIFLRKDDHFRMAANYGFSPELEAFARENPFPIDSESTTIRAAMSGSAIQAIDVLADETQGWLAREYQRLGGHRTNVGVPLRRNGETIGVFTLTRQVVRPFTDKQVQLVSTFADQAVIAIENVRLFEEVRARTRELSEALEQQTATSEVLEVISASTGEVDPVFYKMLENATRICGANFGTLSLYDGDSFRNVSFYNAPEAFAEQRNTPIRPHPQSGLAKIVRTKQPLQIEDLRKQPPYLEGDPAVVALSDLAGARTLVLVPMLRDNELVGTIAIYRQEVRPFTGKQVDVVSNFAKQAVIAIENTRLLNELRQSLQQQTATADVLKVISRSSIDLATVLATLVQTVARLCRADQVYMFQLRHERWHLIRIAGSRRRQENSLRRIRSRLAGARPPLEPHWSVEPSSSPTSCRIQNIPSVNGRRSPVIALRSAFRCFGRIP